MNQFSSQGVWWSNLCSKYKGVIPQPNGRWGAQIYENNQCLWLGTFDSEEAAARATFMSRTSTNLNFEDEEGGTEEHVEDEDNNDGDDDDEREHMFEKPLTPSDVGKLNRLVIPKQHAEKYFPLGGDSVEKGLLLSFEDESGKLWRFRYSYWNSSQSYVLTKGWSRFVKEKQLDAGDVVWFERRRLDGQQLFIRWRRRVPPVQDTVTHHRHHHHQPMTAAAAAAATTPHVNPAWTQMFYSAHPYPSHHLHGSLLYQQPPDCLHAADVRPVLENPTVAVGESTRRPTNSKRLRLFGVNLDCQMDDDESETETAGVDASFMSTTYKVQ